MEARIKREYILENLNCAGCAAKIEREIGYLSGVNKSTINFVSKKLTIEIDNEQNMGKIFNEAIKVVNKYEPDVKVIAIDNNNKLRNKKNSSIVNENNKVDFIKLCISVILLTIAMFLKNTQLISIILFILSYIIVGGEVLFKAIKNIQRGQIFDENFLMALATIGAFAIGQYPEGVAVMVFYQLGEFCQNLAVDNSRRSITELMDIKPDFANLFNGIDYIKVEPEKVKVGDVILIKPGERVPLDGIIINGESTVDTSALTGETLPRSVTIDQELMGGFININGLITLRVTKEFAESTIARILELVQNSGSRKAKAENFVTKFARIYTPVVVVASLMIGILPPLFISGATFGEWIYRALIFLVVSCPCALVLSIPLTFFGGIGGASKQGILIKGSNYLEALNKANVFVFDKTGTLTKGIFEVTEINVENNFTKEDLIKYAAHAEAYSNHPIARSIIKAYGKKIEMGIISGTEELTGLGITAIVENKKVYVGNSRLLKQFNLDSNMTSNYGTLLYVIVDGIYGGSILISDQLKSSTKEAIKELKRLGIKKTIMLTGDIKAVSMQIAEEAGIDEYYSELLPQDKVEWFEKFQKEKYKGSKQVFIGDGINDAPVLARADIGIAMGGIGSDAAIEAADIVIMNDDPAKLVTAINLARKTRRLVLQNIIFALSIKLLVLSLGAVGLASMWEAVFADVGVALIAVLNSMRIMRG